MRRAVGSSGDEFQEEKGDNMKSLSLKRTALVVVFCAGMVVASPGQTFTILASFNGAGGSAPLDARLVQGFDGNYYGTASQGGEYGYGSVYKVRQGF